MAGLLHHRPNPCDHDISDMSVDMLETNGLLCGGQGPCEIRMGPKHPHQWGGDLQQLLLCES